ncbi:MAG: PLD nuclease N-terminal domain-containing protein [Chloroflexota bacterium]|nr:PLDc_N domain-containing protein [Ardenticatenaceae bacterium]
MNTWQQVQEILPLLIPVIIVQIILIIVALRDLLPRSSTRGPKWMWVLIILFVNLVGPIVYFTLGRDDA